MIGTMLGLLIGGWGYEWLGWRGAMMIAGLPGLAFALLMWTTVKEPPRGMADGVVPAPKLRIGVLTSARHLWKIKSYRHICLGSGISSVALFGFSTWMPSLLARSYHMSPGQVGSILGPVLGVVGVLGALVSGYLTDRLIVADARWSVWLPSIASVAAAPFAAAAFLAHSATMTIALYGLSYFLCIFFSAPTSSIVQSLVPLDMRSVAAAWKLLLVNLIGLGLGPLLIGRVSEMLVATAGQESLRQALLYSTPLFVLPCFFYLFSAKYLVRDAAEQGGLVI
jgi:predicted MFS family arabinose efflux permease